MKRKNLLAGFAILTLLIGFSSSYFTNLAFADDNEDKINWNWISSNPNITWDIITNNPDKPWNWNAISKNTMEQGKKQWINDYRLRIIKASQIQRHWRYCISNPRYKLGQKLIEKCLND